MKAIILTVLLVALCGCGANRVLVKDCQDLSGMPGHKNCAKVKDL